MGWTPPWRNFQSFVKIGFAQPDDMRRAESLIAAAVRGAKLAGCGVIAATYADHAGAVGSRADLVKVAANAGATGVLIDTIDKGGPGLRSLITTDMLTAWIADAHDAGLIVSVAGKLTSEDLAWARDCGADIAGVRIHFFVSSLRVPHASEAGHAARQGPAGP